MHTAISLPLAGLFVFLAGFNTWTMLTGRGASSRSRKLWTQAHRIAGYTFIALLAIFYYFMLLRIKSSSDELSPRLMLHMALAFTLAPLLLVKLIAARYQKAAWGLLMTLGIGIFVIAFTLVALNVSVHLLRDAGPRRVPVAISLTVIVAVGLSALVAFFSKGKQADRKNNLPTVEPNQPAGTKAARQGELLNLTLVRIETQTHHAKTLRFLLAKGQQITARPGQFLTFEWIIDGKSVPRSYSISSSPTQAGFIEITAKRVKDGYVSQFLNDRATPGLVVKARGPYGQFFFTESRHSRIVMVAAGSGITPMIAMLRYIDDLCIPAEVTLIYCVRTEQDVFFRNQLRAIQSRARNFRYVLVLSQPDANWTGWKGRLRRDIFEREVETPSEATFFLCGPPLFMDLARTLLKDIGVGPSRILQESFGAAVSGERQLAGADDSPAGLVELKFSRTGTTCSISPDETVLQSAERNGVLMRSGCREGVCGTCATRLLRGKVKMDSEEALNAELRARGFILPCVSRPLSDITLDA